MGIAALIPARYVLAVLGSFGMAIVYGLKVNLSVAMVSMLNHTALAMAGESHGAHNVSHKDVSAPDMEDCGESGNSTGAVEVNILSFWFRNKYNCSVPQFVPCFVIITILSLFFNHLLIPQELKFLSVIKYLPDTLRY